MNGDLIFEVTGRIESGAQLRDLLDHHAGRVQRSIQREDTDATRYTLSADFTSDLRRSGLTLVDACRIVATAVAALEPAPMLYGVEGSAVRGSGEPSLRFYVRPLSGDQHEPPGMLLLDERLPLTGHGALKVDLSSDLMARPRAEYALQVDVPSGTSCAAGGLLGGFDLACGVAQLLPSEPGVPSNLVQLSVRMKGAEQSNSARVRIWRLGFMKVPSRTRLV